MGHRGDGFVRGTVVLAAANLATRLLGVVYWPLVTRIFAPFDGRGGDAGAGLARVPLATYQVVLALSGLGLNQAIAKLVAEHLAVGDAAGARRVFRLALGLTAALGVLCTAAFWWGAPALAAWKGQPGAALGFRAMAPAMLPMTLAAAYRGLFQGLQNHAPNGVSQVLEQVVRVATGVALCWALVPAGLEWGAAAVNFSDVPGALAALAYLVWLYRRDQGAAQVATGPGPAVGSGEPVGAVLGRILSLAAPITLVAAVQPLLGEADTVLVNRLLRAAGVPERDVLAAFGHLTNATQLVWASTLVAGALYTALVPAIAEALALGRPDLAQRRTLVAYRVTLLTGLPVAAGLWALADPLYRLVYGGAGGPVLAASAWGALFLMLQQTSAGVLQGVGRAGLSTRNLLAGAAVKLALAYLLIGPGGLGAMGGAYSTVCGFAVMAALNLWGVWRHLGAGFPAALWWRPLAAALTMAAALRGAVALWPHMGPLATCAWVLAGAVVYALALLLIRGVTPDDLRLIPGGQRLAAALARLGVGR